MKTLTPAMRQYLEIKSQNSDAIVFFRMGDFYEMFFEDARCAAKVLGIALTSRDRDKDIPMCGVPYHAASSYIARLVKDGHKVAVCEQVTDPAESKGLVERAVVKIITPGVALEDEILDPKSNNFIAAASISPKQCGFSYMDVSTGEFRMAEFAGTGPLNDEIRRIRPLELLVEEPLADLSPGPSVKKITVPGKYAFDYRPALERLNAHFGVSSLDGFGCKDMIEGTRAAGALFQYIKETQKGELVHVRKCVPYSTGEYLALDASTRRNLEIIENTSGGKDGTLLDLLDRTKTAMGGRRLKSWLLFPLRDVSRIEERQGAVEELLGERVARASLQELLDHVYDLERLTVKVFLNAANPRDIVSLKLSLQRVPAIKDGLRRFGSALLSSLLSSIDEVPEAVKIIEDAIVDAPPFTVRDGGVIRKGCNAPLDELRDIGSGGKDWIARLESAERQRTGINSLKVSYNRVFGYYIEVTRTNLGNVPVDYIRKQTLVNAERFITPELKEWEEKILTAEEKSKELEAVLFAGVLDKVSGYAPRIQKTAEAVSTLDALLSLAQAASERGYVKPSMVEDDILDIEAGRHPVVEARSQEFVANDLRLGPGERIIILTGPNMAGKSTYLRQNALIVLMAHIGSFVPAGKAVIGVVDRIFTRVGASDDIASGQSTFMVEMNETANILNNATRRSLVILDEIGRGTSTFDGLSIAWAVVEHMHDNPKLRAKTLFATHYHELTELSLTKEMVKNYNMAVKEWGGKVIFLRKVVPGGGSRSYGIQVARLAGMPAAIISRAQEILKNLETGELNEAGMPRIAAKREPDPRQLSLLGEGDPVREELKKIDTDRLTPLDALNALHKMKEMLEN